MAVTDDCAACALLTPSIARVLPTEELVIASLAAGMAIAMSESGPAGNLCSKHEAASRRHLTDAIDAASAEEEPVH